VPKKMKKCSAGGVLQTKQQPLVNRHKMTELHQAALSGDVATIQHIMKNGFDPDQAMEFDWTALHVAALAGKASCAMDLVKGKANINYWNEEGMTALHLAAAKGHTELVGQLIAAGAATDMRTRSGACAHDCAALSGHMSTAEVIPQRYAADPDFDDQNSPYYYEKPNWGTAQVVIPVQKHLSFKEDPKAAESAKKFSTWYEQTCSMFPRRAFPGSPIGHATAPQAASPATVARHIAAVTGAMAPPAEAPAPAPASKKEKKKKGNDKKGNAPAKEASAEDLAKAAAKKEKVVIKEGGKKGVEIEGACDMGGMQFFCTQLDEPDGDMALLEKGFAAMNAEADPTEEERKGGAGGVGKVVFSAGSRALLMICNVPEDKLTDTPAKEEGAPPMKAVAADEWLKSILSKFSKEYPGAKINEGATSTFASASLPANEEKRLFPVKLKDDAMSYAYAYLNERNCMPADDDSDDDYIPQGDFQLEDY